MNLIDIVDFTRSPFILNYRDDRKSRDWFHAHQGIELLFVHNGFGHVVLEQKVHTVSSGTLLLFQPYQLHRIQMNSHQVKYVRSVLNFDPLFLDAKLKPFPSLRSFFRFLWKQKQAYTADDSTNELSELYSRFYARLHLTTPDSHTEEFLVFIISLLHVLRGKSMEVDSENDAPTASLPKYDQHTENVMEWIENRFKEKFCLEELAAELHLSPYHISHLFKEATGISITNYIIARRLKEACLLLGTTNLPINRICNELGLESTSYFSHLFKKSIGVSPKQFRSGIKQTFS